MEPKISVIVPVYNTESYLYQCLDSISAQTLEDIEIICVDDGSTDNSLRILEEYASRDSRIIILQQENKGGGAARNLGMSMAKGKYLSFLDSDDFFDVDMLSKAYESAEKYESDIIIYGYRMYDNVTNKRSKRILGINYGKSPMDMPFSLIDAGSDIFDISGDIVWNKLYKRNFVEDTHVKYMEIRKNNDIYFSTVLACLAKKIVILDGVFLSYRINISNSTQATTHQSPFDFHYALLEIKNKLLETGVWSLCESGFINYSVTVWMHQLYKYKATNPALYRELLQYFIEEAGESLNLLSLEKSDFRARHLYWKYQHIIMCLLTSSNDYGGDKVNKIRRIIYLAIDYSESSIKLVNKYGSFFTLKQIIYFILDIPFNIRQYRHYL